MHTSAVDQLISGTRASKVFEMGRSRDIPVGTKVVISGGSGIDSDKIGTIMGSLSTGFGGRGMGSPEYIIKLQDGRRVTMVKTRVSPLEAKHLASPIVRNRNDMGAAPIAQIEAADQLISGVFEMGRISSDGGRSWRQTDAANPVSLVAKDRSLMGRPIEVAFDDGSTIRTTINGSDEEVTKHYVGTPFTDEDPETGRETTKRGVSVRFLDDEGGRPAVSEATLDGQWKIQTRGSRGWGDVKMSEDDGPYADEHFASKEEADAELANYPDPDGYRVVPASTPSEENFYGEGQLEKAKSLVDALTAGDRGTSLSEFAHSDGNSLDEFTQSYIQAALWSTHDDDGDHLDQNYGKSDLAPSTLAAVKRDCAKFQADNQDAINALGDAGSGEHTPSEQAGHDFWLTRSGHGAGFWDGDWPEPQATQLTDAAKAFGEADWYLGDDGLIYQTGDENIAPAAGGFYEAKNLVDALIAGTALDEDGEGRPSFKGDPTHDEMLEFLGKQANMWGEGWEDDAEVAIYYFANDYHGGQSSNLYSAASTSPYTPGPNSELSHEGDVAQMMYTDLEDHFFPGVREYNAKMDGRSVDSGAKEGSESPQGLPNTEAGSAGPSAQNEAKARKGKHAAYMAMKARSAKHRLKTESEFPKPHKIADYGMLRAQVKAKKKLTPDDSSAGKPKGDGKAKTSDAKPQAKAAIMTDEAIAVGSHRDPKTLAYLRARADKAKAKPAEADQPKAETKGAKPTSEGLLHEMRYSISPDGSKLTITAGPEEMERLADARDIYDALEPLTANSELDWVRAEDVGALTDAPLLGVRKPTDGSEEGEIDGAWGYMDYQVKDPLEELRSTGKLVFVGEGPGGDSERGINLASRTEAYDYAADRAYLAQRRAGGPAPRAVGDPNMAERAEAWARKQGISVPERGTPEWGDLYHKWHAYAFEGWGTKAKARHTSATGESAIDRLISGKKASSVFEGPDFGNDPAAALPLDDGTPLPEPKLALDGGSSLNDRMEQAMMGEGQKNKVSEAGELHCTECGKEMFIEDSGTSHHGTPGAIDHDLDADHVAVSDASDDAPEGDEDADKAGRYEEMVNDIKEGECYVLQDGRGGQTHVYGPGRKNLGSIPGTFADHGAALAAISAHMEKKQFFPNIYSINDHGNVTLIDKEGQEIESWV